MFEHSSTTSMLALFDGEEKGIKLLFYAALLNVHKKCNLWLKKCILFLKSLLQKKWLNNYEIGRTLAYRLFFYKVLHSFSN